MVSKNSPSTKTKVPPHKIHPPSPPPHKLHQHKIHHKPSPQSHPRQPHNFNLLLNQARTQPPSTNSTTEHELDHQARTRPPSTNSTTKHELNHQAHPTTPHQFTNQPKQENTAHELLRTRTHNQAR